MQAKNLQAVANAASLSGKYPAKTQWDITIPETCLHDMVMDAAARHADDLAMDFLGRKMRYADFSDHVSRAAQGLHDMGVEKGTKVGLYMPNTPYYPIMFFAALSLGATVVNYSPLYTDEELARQVEDSDTDFMVTLDLKEFHSKATSLVIQNRVKKMVTCSLPEMLPPLKKFGFYLTKGREVVSSPLRAFFNFAAKGKTDPKTDKDVDYRDLTSKPLGFDLPELSIDDVAVLQYTGGTSGVPKGAVLTHKNLVSNMIQIEHYFGDRPDRDDHSGVLKRGADARTLAAIPYFHVFGMMIGMIASMRMGSELVILPNPRDIKETLKAIDKKKPTLFPAVPRLIQAITEHPDLDRYDLSSLESVIAGGAPLNDATLEAFNRAAGRDNVIKQGYGLSEMSPVASSNPPNSLPVKNDTVGLPYPQTEIKIVNPADDNEIYNIGDVGEICLRGPQLMTGYYKNEDESRAAITNDGWFKTGDLGFLDENLYLKIVDRKKRMIIVNGHNAYPAQIENTIENHPAVAEAVVIGLPDDRSGEAAKAFIRYKADIATEDRPTDDEMRLFLSRFLNKLDVPKYFEVREEELPKTSVGKPDFKALEAEEHAKIKHKQNGPNLN